jgi:RNA methyltransferase, TrmH family
MILETDIWTDPSVTGKSVADKPGAAKPGPAKSGDRAIRPEASGHSRLRPIEGRHNALVKELRRAFADGALTPEGDCAIEGVRMIEEAVRSGLKFRAIFFRNSAANVSARLLPQMAATVETLLLPDKLFDSLVPSETPQGVAAMVRCKQFVLEDVLTRASIEPLLAIAGVQDPGNLGTILRSAEAFGVGGVLLGEGTAGAFNSKVIRASAGSVFRVPAVRTKLTDALPRMREKGLRLVATSSHHSRPLGEVDLSGPLTVFIGSEGAGLPGALLAQMDEVVAIPHSSSVESLNAGVAASIVLYEVARQRKRQTAGEAPRRGENAGA